MAESRLLCIVSAIFSLSDKISVRFLVPNTFRSVVAANSWVEWLEFIRRLKYPLDFSSLSYLTTT